ncbi:MAG TPA: exodeoxyribonuclease VII large subunit [Vicinamibacteria bacterium]|nr:exodeoxyribonuclease VII large subunit [Vicinamibacteria bacterium]
MQQKGLDFGPKEEPPREPRPARRKALTVSELTERIQGVLETEFFDLWVEGEVSNLTLASSGHWYFSLKDEAAQIRAVVWKTQTRLIRFRPKDGMKVIARGRLQVYPKRGEYQIAIEVLEPLGKGALQQAFEELKERLGKEGLFDPGRKRSLPMLPRRIGIVTSPTGAVIRDILRVLRRRYANLEVLIYPARVQGEEAAGELVRGIRALNALGGLDVLLLARGGGSLEDLWPFNEEAVARALAASRIPTLSAVGHETDFTIADFVADLRAPTPSAAAEQLVQAKEEIRARIEALDRRRDSALGLRLTRVRAQVAALTSHRVFEAERGRILSHAQRLAELGRRSRLALTRRLELARDRAGRLTERVEAFRWDRQLADRRERLGRNGRRLQEVLVAGLQARRSALSALVGRLDGLSPLAVLSRGYALVWDASGRLVRQAVALKPGESIRIRVHRGRVEATVTATSPLSPENP